MGSARPAAIIWLLGATVYLVCEALAAASVDGYSYVADFISDLGVRPVMNVGAFMAHGMLFLAGALLMVGTGATRSRVGQVFVLAAFANAVGNVMVGAFHSGTAQAHWHVVGAGLAILGGNIAVIVGGFGSQALGASLGFRRASVALGVFGIACLAVLIVDGADGSHLFAPGLVERGAVYPIIAWELLAAASILRSGNGYRGGLGSAS